MTPAEFIRATRAAIKSDSAREILAHITAPTQTDAEEEREKTPDVIAWESAAVEEISAFVWVVTGNEANAVARIGRIGGIEMITAVRAAKAAQPELVEEISARTDALSTLYLDAKERGYSWPLPAHFGYTRYYVPVKVQGPSQWAALFPDQPAPTLDEVAAMMEAE